MKDIDESKLSPVERLGLAYCRLNCWIWDELVGTKPDGFDRMTYDEKRGYIEPQLNRIEQTLGKPYVDRCWWLYEMGNTEEEWLEWRKSRLAYEKEYNRHENAKRAEAYSEKLQPKIPSILAFCAGFCFGLLLLFVFKALHGGFAA